MRALKVSRARQQALFENGRTFDLSRSIEPTGSFVQMTYPHAAVHRDTIINASHYNVSGTTQILYFFATGEKLQAHLEYLVTGGAQLQSLFYESPTVATAGTPIVNVRLFRPSTKDTQAVVTVGGTVTDDDYGTLLKHQYNGGSGQGANTSGASAVHDDAEWVLKVNTVYCLRLIRGEAQAVSVEFQWYEVPQL